MKTKEENEAEQAGGEHSLPCTFEISYKLEIDDIRLIDRITNIDIEAVDEN